MKEQNRIKSETNETVIRNEKTREQVAWESVFTAVSEFAILKNSPANSFIVAEEITMEGDQVPSYEIRVNPTLLTDEGKIEVIIVDVSYMGETSQQLVAKAAWLDGKPQLVGVNLSSLAEADRYFSSYDIAVRAERIVARYKNMPSLEVHSSASPTMFMGEEYSGQIH